MILKEFFGFLKEYNVIAIAIAFVMGTATDTFIKSFVNNLIMPFFDPLLTTTWRESLWTIGPFRFGIGAFVADLLSFLILAFVIFLVVKRVMKLAQVPKK